MISARFFFLSYYYQQSIISYFVSYRNNIVLLLNLYTHLSLLRNIILQQRPLWRDRDDANHTCQC